VTDEQLDLHLTIGIASALRFFAGLDEKYPDATLTVPVPREQAPVAYDDPARITLD
jgi:hypothetical protein